MGTVYGVTDFERDISGMRPRLVDIWLIPPLAMYVAWRARNVNRWTRRMLFTAGVYMVYRNWTDYKTSAQALASLTQTEGATDAEAVV